MKLQNTYTNIHVHIQKDLEFINENILALGKTMLSISKLAGCAPTDHQSCDSTKIIFPMVETGIASKPNTIYFKQI